ncbi:MAG: T9SS type A sorting domain-containing protein [Melioribacteraceae bacterium]|nr:T9SS type A sorting domain-containing protein [Melioribacteraceae bacterium]
MKKCILLLFTIYLGSLSAQSFNNKVKDVSHIKILAVMAEFEKDTDQNTFGNGKFGSIYSKNYGDTILDPLPFDKQYFENHLLFAKNYFNKVSKGKLSIDYTVLPDVINLDKTMRDYSPTPQNPNDLTKLGKFSEEVWNKVAQQNADFDFSSYDLFVVFHAGVGKEFNPPGSIGGERDMPSIYLGLKSLKEIVGASFTGFNLPNKLVTNTLILPSTESREISTISGDILIELTINGLIVSSIASHLGLPDLFNTTTGTSAIGRTGLMDGESIFAYSGAFPPEPSAWEKIFLGWETPITINSNDNVYSIASSQSNDSDSPTIFKVPINNMEYYLIENRNRDAHNDGATVTYKIGEQTFTSNYTKGGNSFQWYSADTLKGVVVDIDEYDWAAAGNGIYIWHIDENIINEKIDKNEINADLLNRGIKLVEADGINDIGQKFYDIFGETVYGQATEDDFWFKGNKSKYYNNVFSNDSKPDSKSNKGANSLITIDNFSETSPFMSFNLSYNSDAAKRILSTQMLVDNETASLIPSNLGGINRYYRLYDGRLFLIDYKLNYIREFDYFSKISPVLFDHEGSKYIVGGYGQNLNILQHGGYDDGFKTITFSNEISWVSVNNTLNSGVRLIVAVDNKIYSVAFDPVNLTLESFSSDKILLTIQNENLLQILNNNTAYYVLTDKNYYSLSNNNTFTFSDMPIKAALTKNKNGEYVTIVLTKGNRFVVLNSDNSMRSIEPETVSDINNFILADVSGKGENSIIYTSGNKLFAYNFTGALEENYPFAIDEKKTFMGEPVASDIDNDELNEIIAATNSGELFALRDGKVIEGYPLAINESNNIRLFLFNSHESANTLHTAVGVITNLTELEVIDIGLKSDKIWGSSFADFSKTSFFSMASVKNVSSDFLPEKSVYNYPNPVTGSTTNIRYYLKESSEIKIMIFDLAGALVAELNSTGIGGFENETVWDVSNISSGVYYAHVDIKGNSGSSGNKIIKIAVIK